MREDTVSDYDRAIKSLDRAIADATKLRDALVVRSREATRRYPTEPGEGSVIIYQVSWDGKRWYSYAARRAVGLWFSTGSTCAPEGYTWRELIDHINTAKAHSGIFVSTGSRRLTDPQGLS